MQKGQNVRLQVRAPVSGELFYITLEPVFQEEPMMPKGTEAGLALIGDTQGYMNWVDENSKEAARVAIHEAAQRCKDPRNYGPSDGYCNLNSIQDGVGGSTNSPSVEQARIQRLKEKRLGAR